MRYKFSRSLIASSFLCLAAATSPLLAQQAPNEISAAPPAQLPTMRADGQLPPASPAPVTPGVTGNVIPVGYSAPTRLEDVTTSSTTRIAELEQRLAEVEALLARKPAGGESQTQTSAADNAGTVVGADTTLLPKWNYGFEAQTKDKVFRTKFGGQLQFDYTDFNEASHLRGNNSTIGDLTRGAIGPQNESVDFRRLRMRSEGTMYENVGWVVQPDFSNAANVVNVPGNPPDFPHSLHQGNFGVAQTLAIVPTITDAYVTVMKLPVVGNFRVGNFKEPIGLEHLTSSRFLDFMERSYNQDLFYGPFNNGFMPGAMFFNWTEDQRATWALWGGPNQSNLFGYHVGQGQWAGTARGTFLPYYDEPSNGRYLSHFGLSLSARKPDQGQDRFRARGDLRDGPPSLLNTNYLETGSFNTHFQYEFNVEHLTVWGPWTMQAEYFGTTLQDISYNTLNAGGALGPPPAAQQALFTAFQAGQGGGNVYFQGGYIEALYFFTGESRGYDRRMGICDRIVPINNFFLTRRRDGGGCGWGAWQAGLRYSYTNLNSGPINAGVLNAMTVGVNWFLNPNMKFQFNYDITYRSQVDLTAPGWINGAGARLAFDF